MINKHKLEIEAFPRTPVNNQLADVLAEGMTADAPAGVSIEVIGYQSISGENGCLVRAHLQIAEGMSLELWKARTQAHIASYLLGIMRAAKARMAGTIVH